MKKIQSLLLILFCYFFFFVARGVSHAAEDYEMRQTTGSGDELRVTCDGAYPYISGGGPMGTFAGNDGASYPSGNSWICTRYCGGTWCGGANWSCHAVCSSKPTTIQATPIDSSTVIARCPPGKYILGGGINGQGAYNDTGEGIPIRTFCPPSPTPTPADGRSYGACIPGDGWQCQYGGGYFGSPTCYAICGDEHTSIRRADGHTDQLFARCSAAKEVTGGGRAPVFAGNDAGQSRPGLEPQPPTDARIATPTPTPTNFTPREGWQCGRACGGTWCGGTNWSCYAVCAPTPIPFPPRPTKEILSLTRQITTTFNNGEQGFIHLSIPVKDDFDFSKDPGWKVKKIEITKFEEVLSDSPNISEILAFSAASTESGNLHSHFDYDGTNRRKLLLKRPLRLTSIDEKVHLNLLVRFINSSNQITQAIVDDTVNSFLEYTVTTESGSSFTQTVSFNPSDPLPPPIYELTPTPDPANPWWGLEYEHDVHEIPESPPETDIIDLGLFETPPLGDEPEMLFFLRHHLFPNLARIPELFPKTFAQGADENIPIRREFPNHAVTITTLSALPLPTSTPTAQFSLIQGYVYVIENNKMVFDTQKCYLGTKPVTITARFADNPNKGEVAGTALFNGDNSIPSRCPISPYKILVPGGRRYLLTFNTSDLADSGYSLRLYDNGVTGNSTPPNATVEIQTP